MSLVVVSHPKTAMLGRSIELPVDGSLVLGRGPAADVDFAACTEISRAHARVWEAGGVVRVEDLGSRNGTFVNGDPVTESRTLASGDALQLGTIYLKFFAGHHVERAFYETMYELASRDELTGVHNRRKLEEELAREFALATRYQRPLTLVLLDVDGLKAINDRHGHRAGDAVLRQLADLVGREVRREVVFARLGGDEFALLCPETDVAGAGAMVDRLRAAIARHRFSVDALDLEVTCSFGLAQASPALGGPDELYEAADDALYAGKARAAVVSAAPVPRPTARTPQRSGA
jgi:diguanylate cyclase (GGDEF)-like protein